MSVAIRLKRHGTRNHPFYRVVVIDSRRPRDGRVIEEVGRYQPTEPEGSQAVLDAVRIHEWISKGARPSNTVKRILNKQLRGGQSAVAPEKIPEEQADVSAAAVSNPAEAPESAEAPEGEKSASDV